MANSIDNRRIGSRTAVDVAVRIGPIPKRGLLRRSTPAVSGHLTNLSVSGAVVECTGCGGLAKGDHTFLTGAEGRALVEVRRVEELGDKRFRYGLLFVEIDPDFQVALNEASQGNARVGLEWRWDSAH
jgi:hypothetical protein